MRQYTPSKKQKSSSSLRLSVAKGAGNEAFGGKSGNALQKKKVEAWAWDVLKKGKNLGGEGGVGTKKSGGLKGGNGGGARRGSTVGG